VSAWRHEDFALRAEAGLGFLFKGASTAHGISAEQLLEIGEYIADVKGCIGRFLAVAGLRLAIGVVRESLLLVFCPVGGCPFLYTTILKWGGRL